jgi:ferric-dicitrate binding protein FerR (iron transport regulator)
MREDTPLQTEESLEQLLRRARPRRAPPDADREQVRRAVEAEWLAVTRQRRRRRRWSSLAAAATVLLAVAGTLYLLRFPGVAPIAVATIDRSIGSLYLLGERSELTETGEFSVLTAGETIVTGSASGAAMRWHQGGQLRLDADTRVDLVADDTVFLRSGRIYFDSQASPLSDVSNPTAASRFVVRTVQGTVAPAGTQFMTAQDERTMTVSVREGEVRVDGDYYDGSATAGQRLVLEGRNRPVLANIPIHGGAWSWVESIAPPALVENPTVYQFLSWVARETGLELRFATPEAERIARRDKLIGRVDAAPRDALRLWMSTVDLDWHIVGDAIVIEE